MWLGILVERLGYELQMIENKNNKRKCRLKLASIALLLVELVCVELETETCVN